MEKQVEVIGGPDESTRHQTAPDTKATPSTPPSNGKGLFGDTGTNQQAPVDPNANGSNVPPTADSPWKWGEGINGVGSKPEYLQTKFASVEDQAKGYVELEKRLGTWKGAPKDGYDMSKIPETVNPDDPLLKGFSEAFKELNLNQEGFEKVVGKFAELQAQYSAQTGEQIMKDLGTNAKEVLDRVGNWIKNHNEADQEIIKSWVQNAKDVEVLDRIRSGRPLSKMPTANEIEPRHMYETSKDVEAERNKPENWKRYKDDDAYRQGILDRWTRALEREGKA